MTLIRLGALGSALLRRLRPAEEPMEPARKLAVAVASAHSALAYNEPAQAEVDEIHRAAYSPDGLDAADNVLEGRRDPRLAWYERLWRMCVDPTVSPEEVAAWLISRARDQAEAERMHREWKTQRAVA